MCGKAKSYGLSSSGGVRHGENVPPILFSLFLNDITQFMSKFYNGSNLLTEGIHSLFNNQDVEVYFSTQTIL